MKDMNYGIGLDIGITSVGWAVINLDLQRIEDLGVRIFNAAEEPKTGASLAMPRRLARGRRRLLRRKSYRIRRVKKLIVENNIITEDSLENLFKNSNITDVWEARIKGLDYELSNEEWAKVLINLCKRRGFKSNRKNEVKDKETGALITSINKNLEFMKESNSRTIGESIYKRVKESKDEYAHLRNKSGEYGMCVSRDMIREEIHILFESQRRFNKEFATDEIEDRYLEIFDSQRPYSDFGKLEKLVGYCTFEKDSKRAPKKCISAEEFILYDNLNKVSILFNGEKRKLSEEEKECVVKEAFKKKEIKYSALRKLLKLEENERFSTLTYSIDKDKAKTEDTKFVSLVGYYELKKAIEKGVSKEYWNEIKEDKKTLNEIAYVLTLGKTDTEIEEQLLKRDIDKRVIENVMDISFSKFNNLSVKAINKILPFMKKGYQYNEACEKAGYDFKDIYKGEKTKKLPIIDIQEIVNPVVNRALAQTRKVVNAIIDKYGSPVKINIELARELSKNFKDRKVIEKEQKENRVKIDKIRAEIEGLFNKKPTYTEVLKYRLWEMQNGECAYSQRRIGIEELFSSGYCEIDHIIPFSRSFDDKLTNKVLVLSTENQNKANRTPFEYFGDDEERWNKFEVWVNSSNLKYKKKMNLLKKGVNKEEEKEWKERNLQDTKYICKYIANFIENKLEFKESERKRKVLTINGGATAILRGYWGLTKVREDGDKHHALDVAVVGVATFGLVQKISKYSKARETKYKRVNDEFVDVETGEIIDLEEYKEERKELFPRPWRAFPDELKIRLSNTPVADFYANKIESYDKEFVEDLKPICVSRMPVRKVNGKVFGETVYSKGGFKSTSKTVKLEELKKKDLENLWEQEKNKELYNEIKERMNKFKNKGKEAFKEEVIHPITKRKIIEVNIKDKEVFIAKINLKELKKEHLSKFYNYNCDKELYKAIKFRMEKFNYDAKKAFEEEFRKPTKSGKKGPIVRSVKIIRDIPFKDGIEFNEGLVAKEGMVRIDIYEKESKYYVVPVYRYHIANRIIPNRAATAGKSENEWIEIDKNYKFKFSLYKNDLVEIRFGKKQGYFGYYDGFDRSTASITIKEHDASAVHRGIGIKSDVIVFNKYNMNVLGEYHLEKERRK